MQLYHHKKFFENFLVGALLRQLTVEDGFAQWYNRIEIKEENHDGKHQYKI